MSSPAGTRQAEPGTYRTRVTITRRGKSADVTAITGALWLLTAGGALLGLVLPGLAPAGSPHPTLYPNAGAAAGILAQNVRVLAAPYLLALFRFDRTPSTRLTGDLLVAGILATNALRVGLALGRWQIGLLPYLPQLPLEYLAAATAASAWTERRRQPCDLRGLAPKGLHTSLLLAAAALVEVLATPHAK